MLPKSDRSFMAFMIAFAALWILLSIVSLHSCLGGVAAMVEATQ